MVTLGDLALGFEIERLGKFFVLLFNGYTWRSRIGIRNRTVRQVFRALVQGLLGDLASGFEIKRIEKKNAK